MRLVIGALVLVGVAAAATIQVDMRNFFFDPESVSIDRGDTIVWFDVEGNHTSTSGVNGVPDGYWDSGLLSPGQSFSFVFDTVGTFLYYCTPHWTFGMTGVVMVNPTGIEESELGLGQATSVEQNYPNPFISSTKINYTINSQTVTEISVYDASGQKIKTLVRQNMAPGDYSVTWSGENEGGVQVPAGVYFYEIKKGDDITKGKMLVLR